MDKNKPYGNSVLKKYSRYLASVSDSDVWARELLNSAFDIDDMRIGRLIPHDLLTHYLPEAIAYE